MKTRKTLAFAATAVLVLSPALATAQTDAAHKLMDMCMKAPPASPAQARCLAQVEALRKKQAPVKATATKPAPASTKPAPPVPPEVKVAAANLAGAGIDCPVSPAPVGIEEMKKLDLESAMMLVQTRRAELLESKLKCRLDDAKYRNARISELNDLISALEGRIASKPLAKPDDWINLGAKQAEGQALYARIKVIGLPLPPKGPDEVNEPGTGIYDARLKTLRTWVQSLKERLDKETKKQEMDPLTQEALSAQLNRDVSSLEDYLKKLAESRGYAGRMR